MSVNNTITFSIVNAPPSREHGPTVSRVPDQPPVPTDPK
jgi:hypothetical protein